MAGIVPGKYRVLALESTNPYQQLPFKRLEGRGEEVEITEDGRATVMVSVIPAADLQPN